MADILDVQAPNEKRKQLLAFLMQQMAQSATGGRGALAASASASPAARSQAGGHTIFGRSNARGAGTNVTQGGNVSASLRALLGPGGFGLATAAEHSQAPGLPVPRPIDPGFSPRHGADDPGGLPVGPGRGNGKVADIDPGFSGGLGTPAPANPLLPVSHAAQAQEPLGGGAETGAKLGSIDFAAAPSSAPLPFIPGTTSTQTFSGTPAPANRPTGGVMGLVASMVANALKNQPAAVNTDLHVASPIFQARGNMGSYQAL